MTDFLSLRPAGGFGLIMADREKILRRLAADPASALEIGKAAEHLVASDLILNGYRCYLSDQGLPYDLCVDIDGWIVRVQVKATCFPKNLNASGRAERIGYSFHVRRRGKAHKGQRLNETMCDIVALVAVDIRAIHYLPIFRVGQTMQFADPRAFFNGKPKGNASMPPMTNNLFVDALESLNAHT